MSVRFEVGVDSWNKQIKYSPCLKIVKFSIWEFLDSWLESVINSKFPWGPVLGPKTMRNNIFNVYLRTVLNVKSWIIMLFLFEFYMNLNIYSEKGILLQNLKLLKFTFSAKMTKQCFNMINFLGWHLIYQINTFIHKILSVYDHFYKFILHILKILFLYCVCVHIVY